MSVAGEGGVLLAIAGGIGAGKTTLARSLQSEGWLAVGLSDIVRDVAKAAGQPLTRGSLQALGDAYVRSNPEQFASEVVARSQGQAKVVLDGIRHRVVWEVLTGTLPRRRQCLVFLEVPRRVRLARAALRDQLAIDSMIALDDHPLELAGQRLREDADLVVLANGPVEQTLHVVKAFLS